MEQRQPREPRADIADCSEPYPILRRFFPAYCLLAALVTYGYALWDPYQVDGDAVSYMDIGDNLRAHHWAGIVNGYWHPMYPAFLSLGHIVFRATLPTELRAYYFVNFFIFLLGMLAIVCLTDALVRLRAALSEPVASESASQRLSYLLDRTTLRYLGVALVVIASQRELSLGKIRPDSLLQAFMLFALAALLAHLATSRLRYAALMGVALGCAYLTKSFAFVFALLCILALVVFRWLWLRHAPARVVYAALIALGCFAVVAGPYVAALSQQRGRFDFGDSGSLNYAWYVGGTGKMHLQPYMTSKFGSAEVNLKHPEKELLRSPQVLSYAEMPYGTYPDWFDTTYWNDQIKPHFALGGEISRGSRNLVLVVRYLFNHPEALILLALFILLGARLALAWKPSQPGANPFWLIPLLLGVLIWGIYATVNTEERYVTIAFLAIVLTLFATLHIPEKPSSFWRSQDLGIDPFVRLTASALILLLALLATGESLRTVLEDRRQLRAAGYPGGWYNPDMVHVAEGLSALGVRQGDTVACIGFDACLSDPYWARLAGVRILTEIYDPDTPVSFFLANLSNRDQVIDIVRAQGTKILVGDFDQIPPTYDDPAFRDWHRLAGTTLYALPLNP